MNRSEVIRAVARKSQVRVPIVDDVLSTFFDVVTMNLSVEEEVSLRGFGKFEPRSRPPVTLKNPQTGDPIPVDERKTVVFLPSPNLKEKLNAPL